MNSWESWSLTHSTGRRANVMPLRAELKHSSGITVVGSSNIEMTVGTPRSLPICRFRDMIWSSRTVFGALDVHGLQHEGSLKISCLHQPGLMQAKGNVFSTSQSLYHSLSISVWLLYRNRRSLKQAGLIVMAWPNLALPSFNVSGVAIPFS